MPPRPSAAERPRSIPEQIASTLGTRVMAGELKPGAHLKGPDLAAEFGVSRVTIHDALRILERHGLAEIHARRGAFVSDPTHSELTEILDIRAVLFGLAARTACEEGDDAFIREFEAGVQRQCALATDESTAPEDYGAASVGLQSMVAAASGNVRLAAMLADLTNRSIWRLVFRDGPIDHTTVQRRSESAAIWTELAQALARRDADAAETKARKLIGASRAHIIAVMSGERSD